MGKWSNWKKLRNTDNVFPPEGESNKPGVYELGKRHFFFAGLFDIGSKYVGETGTLRTRLNDHANLRSHLKEVIESSTNAGYVLYYRRQIKSSKQDAVTVQDNLLKQYDYKWNSLGTKNG